jgi:glycosyltransferase involved in cell wall biosynthesis
MQKFLHSTIKDYDLLHLHSIFRWPTWAAARAAHEQGRPYVISPRGMLVRDLIERRNRWLKLLWLQAIEKHTLEHAAAIHSTTELEATEMKKFPYKWPPVFVVPNGVNVEDQAETGEVSLPLQKVVDQAPYFLYMGRLNWKKGLDRLIPALSSIGGAQLVIAGNDDENYKRVIHRLAEKHGVSNRLTYTGYVTGRNKTELLKHAVALVLPSYSENFGNVVLEAMAAGCPVVVSREVGLADVVNEKRAGLVVNGETDSLGKALQDLLGDKAGRQKMGENGKRAASECFDWNSIALRMLHVYEHILTEHGLKNP